jgi:hypothetical protein
MMIERGGSARFGGRGALSLRLRAQALSRTGPVPGEGRRAGIGAACVRMREDRRSRAGAGGTGTGLVCGPVTMPLPRESRDYWTKSQRFWTNRQVRQDRGSRDRRLRCDGRRWCGSHLQVCNALRRARRQCLAAARGSQPPPRVRSETWPTAGSQPGMPQGDVVVDLHEAGLLAKRTDMSIRGRESRYTRANWGSLRLPGRRV